MTNVTTGLVHFLPSFSWLHKTQFQFWAILCSQENNERKCTEPVLFSYVGPTLIMDLILIFKKLLTWHSKLDWKLDWKLDQCISWKLKNTLPFWEAFINRCSRNCLNSNSNSTKRILKYSKILEHEIRIHHYTTHSHSRLLVES